MPFLIKVIGVLVSLSMRYNSNVSKEKIKLENQLKKLSLDRDTDREWNNYLQEKQNKKKWTRHLLSAWHNHKLFCKNQCVLDSSVLSIYDIYKSTPQH